MKYPLISIIIPSYNQGNYIEETILSILSQNYPETEIIIIDGGSTDNTIDIINKYESFIYYWVSEADNGQAHAINKGLKVANGEIINWINSDDYLESNSLISIAESFLKNPKASVLCGYTRCFIDETDKTTQIYRMGLKRTSTNTLLFYSMNQPGTFYRKKVLDNLNGVNESLRYVFDNELWFKFLASYGVETVCTTDSLIAHFRLHNNSKSIGEGFEKFWLEQNDIWLHLSHQLNLSPALLSAISKLPRANAYVSNTWDLTNIDRNKFECYWYEKYANTLYLNGEFKETRKAILSMFRNKTFKLSRVNLSLLFKSFIFPVR